MCIYATTSSLSNRNVKIASERCLAQRLHRYCELFMNTNPFRVCVCFNVNAHSKHTVSTSTHTHCNTLYVNMYVGHIYRISGSSWYLHLKVNLNQFPCSVGDACLKDFWLIERVSSTLFNHPSEG